MTIAETIRRRIPGQLWMIWSYDTDSGGGVGVGDWISSLDEIHGGESYIVCLSEEEAVRTAEAQQSAFGMATCRCIPIRVK